MIRLMHNKDSSFLIAVAASLSLSADGLAVERLARSQCVAAPSLEAASHGRGLTVTPSESGARLRCVVQRLEGEATPEGLWLQSRASSTVADSFRVVARSVGRVPARAPSGGAAIPAGVDSILPGTGDVSVEGHAARFTRPGLTEEYSVSMDGVRQDFVVASRPDGTGELRVQLEVTGAVVEPAAYGAQLLLPDSGRKIAYSRLHVTDAAGRELPARMEVSDKREIRDPKSEIGLDMLVDDTDAVYPVRIDPTFSDANWISMGGLPGVNGAVHAAVADGSGNLYIGGSFTIAGNVFATNIAKWDGRNWSALGSGAGGGDHPAVSALVLSGSEVYAGGRFITAGGIAATNIAKWNGSNWSALAQGIAPDGCVSALAMSGNDLYAGGSFTAAGGNMAVNIAKWNGSNWSALAQGIGPDGYVTALAVSGSDLYAGGYFTMAGGTAATNIAKWNGSSWNALAQGIGPDGYVSALAMLGNDLYAGGFFTTAGGTAATNVAKWNGSTWSALGSGIGGGVSALAVSGSEVYTGGEFETAGDIAADNIAKWDGNRWRALGEGLDVSYPHHGDGTPAATPVLALATSGSDLYAGGAFTTDGGSAADFIAQWDGSSWSTLAHRANATVSALTMSGIELYAAGGYFTTDSTKVNYVAQWDGSSWTLLASAVVGRVDALAASANDLYAGGQFTTVSGITTANIAKWNGSSWTPLGSGIEGDVYALALSGTDLYAAGYFSTAGGTAARNIAKWNGSSWSPLGSGVDGYVYALAVSGSDLYAGGYQFTRAGDTAANSIAKWNGSSWSALGSGLWGGAYPPIVSALAVSGSGLYAGGRFTTAGDVIANNIAKWNGSSWSPLGSGIGRVGELFSSVYALAVSGSDVYAGGTFTTAGGSPANYIAKWNGSSWSALGEGMNGDVMALALSGGELYAGGYFTTAGGKVSANVARAYLERPTLALLRSGSDVIVSWPSFYGAFVLEESADAANSNGWSTASYPIITNGVIKSATIPLTNSKQVFRLVEHQ